MMWSDLERFGSWDPWREFDRMRRQLARSLAPAAAEFPSLNVWTSADGAIVTTELPGVEPKDIEIAVEGSSLTLKGTRKPEEMKEGTMYHRRERWHGQFSRSVDLPYAVQTDKVHAKFSKGILTISLPRAEAEKPRKIEIRSE